MDIASPPDREKLVAEMFFGSDQWAEVNHETNEVRVEFYARADGRPWNFSLTDAITALNIAKQRLLDGGE